MAVEDTGLWAPTDVTEAAKPGSTLTALSRLHRFYAFATQEDS
jgi:hypothetical protein